MISIFSTRTGSHVGSEESRLRRHNNRAIAGALADSGQVVAIRTEPCAVQGAGPQWVQIPPGNWIAPPGSNRSSRGGNESAGAFGVEGRIGDLAIMQAVMEVNAEQAPKPEMQEPTRRLLREGRR